jgi:two-component system sensor histidine kinase QseC
VGNYYLLEREMHFYSLLAVALLFPISGGIAFFIINKAVDSLKSVTKEVSNRASNYLEPMNISGVPKEVMPLVDEINLLLSRLKQGFEREKRFAADAAHELRTPLAALKTQAQVALQATDPDVQRLALQNVVEGVNRSTHLVQQLLTLSRLLTQAETTFELSDVSLHRLAVEILADMAPQAINKHIDIELLPQNEEVMLQGNAKALKALLFNLVDNAVRYIPEEGGSILVSIENKKEKIILTIRDSGPGIPEEYHNRIFEWFFRVTGNSAQGSGLGFAIIEQVVKLHHAEISISTPSSGKGLEVNILFPVVKKGKVVCH